MMELVQETDMKAESARSAPIAMEPAAFRALGHQLVDELAQFLESLPERPVTRDESPSAVREALRLTGSLPEAGTEAGPLLEETARLLFDHSLLNSHPRFFGYITAPPALIGFPADCGGLLVSGGNMANFVCLLAARAARANWDVRARGAAGTAGERLR